MDPSIKSPTNIGCKNLLLKKLSKAVLSSILLQLVLLTHFIFVAHLNLFNPVKWIVGFTQTLTSLTTWLLITPFLCIVFAQTLVCAKDYVLRSMPGSTRIGRFFAIFSIRNLILLSFHVVTGSFFVWLFFNFTNTRNKLQQFNESMFWIIFGGWIGLYYFIRIYSSDNSIDFPIIQQRKLLRFQSNLIPILKSCQRDVLNPLVIFFGLYYFYIKNLDSRFPTINLITFIYSYILGMTYIFNMKLTRLFFELFLTQPHEFPIVPFEGALTLKDAMETSHIPIVQHLACLDLLQLANNSKPRREEIFTLSQPGHHPHNWNSIVESALKNLSVFTQGINESIASVLITEDEKKMDFLSADRKMKKPHCGNIRNMALGFQGPTEYVTVTRRNLRDDALNNLENKMKSKLDSIVSIVKKRTGINYLFEQLPLANIQLLLSNGQVIIWTVEGLASLCTASLTEDKFGVVQKDLPVILCSFVDLKQSIEKLNRTPVLNKKAADRVDRHLAKMKANISSAVRRSLYCVCREFGPYLRDLPLKSDVLQLLQIYTHH